MVQRGRGREGERRRYGARAPSLRSCHGFRVLLCTCLLCAAFGVAAQESGDEPAAAGDRANEAPRTMDTLLDDAVSGPPPSMPASKQVNAKSPKVLPHKPTAEGLRAAIKVLSPAIRGCAMGGRGRVDMVVVLRSDGSVLSARVAGPPYAGTTGGTCMEGALRKARFPAFSAPRVRLRIPFLIR